MHQPSPVNSCPNVIASPRDVGSIEPLERQKQADARECGERLDMGDDDDSKVSAEESKKERKR